MKGLYISDSIHGLVQMTYYEREILSSTGFNRLHDIYQNSTVYMTFPSNRTKRFEHSIGTMKLASDIYRYSIQNASEGTLNEFFISCRGAINDIIKITRDNEQYKMSIDHGIRSIDELDFYKNEGFITSLTPSNVPIEDRNVNFIIVQSIRIVALLHDIGHPPFSHIVEFALKEMMEDEACATHEDFERIKNNYNIYAGAQLHEQIGTRITESIFDKILKELNRNHENNQIELKRYILLKECVLAIMRDDPLFGDLHKIIDGTIDADRLDYVTRDPLNSGIKCGFVDYDRIIPDMKLICITENEENRFCFCASVKAVNAIEDFLKRRFDLYKKIIYHHRVIKTDELLKQAVKLLITEHIKDAKTITHDEDNSYSSALPQEISGIWMPINTDGKTEFEANAAFAQWNDSWLLNLFAKEYYSRYIDCTDTSEDNGVPYKIHSQLSELVENKKQYQTLIKRSEHFEVLDKAAREAVAEHMPDINKNINRLKELSKEKLKEEDIGIYNKDSDSKKQRTLVDQAGVLEYLKIFESKHNNPNRGFVISNLLHMKSVFKYSNSKIEKICIDVFKDDAQDVLVVFKKIKTGLEGECLVYNGDETMLITETSTIKSLLEKESLSQPPFYLYVLGYEGGDKDGKLKEIGTRIGKYIAEDINKRIEFQISTLVNS